MEDHIDIGVMFRREQSPQSLVNYARRAEAFGFDELWVVEDCFYMGGIAQAATALAATERVNVGLGIAPAVARNAAFLAMEFATLAHMHPGRVHGGIGHGVAEWMDQVGARPRSWLAAIEETTTAVRAIMRGELVTFDGQHVHLRDVRLDEPPGEAPPISLGVRGPKSLALSGRCADGTILAENSAPAYVSWAREHIANGAAQAGRSGPHRLTVYANCAVSADQPDIARDAARRATIDMLGGEATVQTSPLPYAGDLARLLGEGRDVLSVGLQDAWLDELAVTGTPEDGAAAIRRLAGAGADAIVLVPPVDVEKDAWLDTVGSELLPLLH